MMVDNRRFGSDLTRREALALVGVGGLTALAPSRSPAQPVGASPCVADIAIAAKRFDKGSGSAAFTGCIPLKPGQLFEVGTAGSRQLTMSLWNGAVEVGAYFTCLYPQHPDGSVKSLRISATLSVNTGVTLPLTLKLGTAAVAAGPAQHPVINRAWMQDPVLIGCTDAAHMCAARVAFGPLVPITHPNLPASWVSFLSTEFDNGHNDFPTYKVLLKHLRGSGTVPSTYGTPTGFQGANYNCVAPMYYRYMMTGDLEKLCDAHRLSAQSYMDDFSWNPPTTPGGYINYGNGPIARYHTAYEGNPAFSNFPIDEYGQAFNQSPVGTGEHQSGFHQSAYMCYVMSGWGQPLGVAISFGMRHFLATPSFGAFANYPWPNIGPGTQFHTPSAAGGWGGARQNFRNFREADAFLYMLSLPMDLNAVVYGPYLAPTPRNAANKAKYHTFFQRKYYDSIDLWSKEFARPGQPNSFLHGLWGFSPLFTAGTEQSVQGTSPNFQLITLFNILSMCYMNIIEDARFQTKVGELAEFLLTQVVSSAPITHPAAVAARRPPCFRMPYMTTDPATAGSARGPNFYTTTMLLALWAWGYRVTGNPHMLTIADAHASIYSMAHPSPSSGVGHRHKQLGETYHMAFYAAAWRAGETWGVVPGDVPPKPTPGCR